MDELIVFRLVAREGEWKVYRCENDESFYYLVPRMGVYSFKPVLLPETVERYERMFGHTGRQEPS
jgi:hypothetical protein